MRMATNMRWMGLIPVPAMFLFAAAVSAQQAMPSGARQGTAITVTSNLVVVDVVVRDKSGHAVHGLKQGDFAVFEENTAEGLRNFEEHTSAEVRPGAVIPKLPPGVFTNMNTAPASGPLNILVFDKFDTSLTNQERLRQQMLSFIDKARPGTRMAIFAVGDHLRLLQGFTDDRVLLRAAMSAKNTTQSAVFARNSVVANDSLANGSGLVGGQEQVLPRGNSAPPMIAPTLGGETDGPLVRARSYTMRDTLEFLAMYLGDLPGRKNLLWFSDRFPFNLFAGDDMMYDNYVPSDDFKHVVAELVANQVSIYPIATGGTTDRLDYMELKELAYESGGRAFYYTNARDEAAAEAIEDGSNYYTLGYTPTNTNWNGSYRKIEVRLTNGMNAELSYRRGYYADDPNKTLKPSLLAHTTTTKDARPSAMQMAMMLGVPDARQVFFTAKVAPGATESMLAAGNEGSKNLKGPYKRYTIGYGIDAGTLAFRNGTDGLHHGALEMVTFVYDATGNLVNAMGSTVHADVKPAVYESILQNGLPLRQEVSVPAKGEYTLRIAVHDLMNDHIGTIEVASSAVGMR